MYNMANVIVIYKDGMNKLFKGASLNKHFYRVRVLKIRKYVGYFPLTSNTMIELYSEYYTGFLTRWCCAMWSF